MPTNGRKSLVGKVMPLLILPKLAPPHSSRARPSVLDRLVGEGPEVSHDARKYGGFQHALGEEDAGEILLRIPRACSAEATDPAQPSRRRGKINALGVDTHAESPAYLEPAVTVAEKHFHAFLLRVG